MSRLFRLDCFADARNDGTGFVLYEGWNDEAIHPEMDRTKDLDCAARARNDETGFVL